MLKSARRQRETYVGPWLPEPVIEDEQDDMDEVTLPDQPPPMSVMNVAYTLVKK